MSMDRFQILVPVDFSSASEAGLHYAMQLAKQTPLSLTALHVLESFNSSVQILYDNAPVAFQKAKQKLRRFTQPYPNQLTASPQLPISMNQVVREGHLIDTINSAVEEQKSQLIVMGTKSKHSILEYLTGSITSTLIGKASIPILVVPEGYSFRPIQKMVYATNMYEQTADFSFLTELTDRLRADLEKVYVFPFPKDYSEAKEEKYEPGLFMDQLVDNLPITIIRETSVSKGLNYFMDQHDTDILVLHFNQRKGLSKYFHRSVIKQLVLKAPLPILII